MKEYTITVNGHVYDVTVEEKGNSAQIAQTPAPAAPVAAPAAAAPAPQSAPASADGTPIKASVPGKIVRLEKKAGDPVASGETVLIQESMKMEIPVVSTADGTLASFMVKEGDMVEAGDTLALLS